MQDPDIVITDPPLVKQPSSSDQAILPEMIKEPMDVQESGNPSAWGSLGNFFTSLG
jgi:hypothetical protein